jgi:hypothetical protein
MTAVKVVRFLAGGHWPPGALRERWSRALGGAARRDRPFRVAVAEALTLPDLPPPRFTAVDIQWFTGVPAALANDTWLRSAAPDLVDEGSCRVVAEEVVVRGRDYLDARWQGGGERYKMMSFGKRSPRLTLEEFSARWRSEAGRLGDQAIPEDVRGLAYVQNHPVPLDGHEWPFDAVNEVYVERLDDLHRRGAWFAARQEAALRSRAEGFMSPAETGSLFVREWPAIV